jgi:hypothetical protein
MKMQTKGSNTGSEEDECRNRKFFGNINHGGAEHVYNEGSDRTILFSSSEIRDGLSNIWFLSFEESVEGGSSIGVWRKRTFWKVNEVERIGDGK